MNSCLKQPLACILRDSFDWSLSILGGDKILQMYKNYILKGNYWDTDQNGHKNTVHGFR